MRPFSSVCLAAVLSFAMPPSRPALAQAGGDQRALDALGPSHSARHARHVAHHGHAGHAVAATPQATSKPVAARLPAIPPAPPPVPVFKAPVIDVPLHPEPPPPPVPVVAGAAGSASSIADGSRITFGAGSADLNAATMAALHGFATRLQEEPEARAEIDAYAAGTSDDPSTPRRMSLSRGLAARAVLINAGVPSTRIYVRAIGQPSDSGPADRVDLTDPEAAQRTPDQRTPDQPTPDQPGSSPPPSGPSTKAVAPP